MADSFVQVPPDSTGKQVDAASLPVGGQTVQRQRVVLGDNTGTATYATILSAGPVGTEGGLVVRNIPSGTQSVLGQVSLAAGTAKIGFIGKISAGVAVTGTVSLGAGTNLIGAVSLAAGTANIGTINNISAAVVLAAGTANIGAVSNAAGTALMGAVSLAAGTANIGSINNISATVVVSGAVSLAAGANNIGTINNISATVVVSGAVSLAAGANNIGTINNISATVVVSGAVSLAAGANNIGTINNISATVNTVVTAFLEKTTNSQVLVADSANAALRVNVVAGSSGGPSIIDNTTYSTGVTTVAGAGFMFFDASAVTVTEGRMAAARITTNRAVHMNLRTDGGARMEDSANTALRVNVVAGSASVPSLIDNTTFSTGVTQVIGIGYLCLSASATLATEGNMAAARITNARAVHTSLRNNAGTEIGTPTTPLSVRVENQSATLVVSGTVSLGAGAANIGTINNISATVVVSGAVSLAAGTSVFGTLNNISATVIVAGEIANGASLSTTNKPVLIGGNTSAGGAGGLAATLLLDTTGAIKLGAGANNIGAVSNAAGTALMGAVSLAAGTANIGSINNISATVVVSGAVSLAAGANNIGTINNISATVVVSGAVSLAAGTNVIGTINNISATVVVSGAVSLAAGANNIGTVNNISAASNCLIGISSPALGSNATTKAVWGDGYGRQVMILNHPSLYNTASHGPKCVTCSTSATTAIVAAPGAGLCVYITKIAATNGSATLTRGDVYGVSATATAMCSLHMAASGGGYIMDYNPPIKTLSNSAVNCRVKPSVSKCMFNVHFYVGPK